MNLVPAILSSLPSSHSPDHNCFLAALPAEIFEHISPYLELISIPLRDVLYESSGQLQYIYFPTTAIVSLHCIMQNGSSGEIAGVGNEGVVGIALFMGSKSTYHQAIVNTGGYGYRLKSHLLMEELSRVGGRRAGVMQHLLLRYTQTLIVQMSQMAICNRHHSIEQQLCRWLLMTLDRLHTNELFMTHELVAEMLGVRREGITEAAGNLQRVSLISYRRGHITIINRAGLESRTCECYQVVRKEFKRLFRDMHNHTKHPLVCCS